MIEQVKNKVLNKKCYHTFELVRSTKLAGYRYRGDVHPWFHSYDIFIKCSKCLSIIEREIDIYDYDPKTLDMKIKDCIKDCNIINHKNKYYIKEVDTYRHATPLKKIVNPILRWIQFFTNKPYVIGSLTEIINNEPNFVKYVFKRVEYVKGK